MFFTPVSLSGPPQGSSNNFWGLKVHSPILHGRGADLFEHIHNRAIHNYYALTKAGFTQTCIPYQLLEKQIDKSDLPIQIDNRQNFRATDISPDVFPVGCIRLSGLLIFSRMYFVLFSFRAMNKFFCLSVTFLARALFSASLSFLILSRTSSFVRASSRGEPRGGTS